MRSKRVASYIVLSVSIIVAVIGGAFLGYYKYKSSVCTESVTGTVIALDWKDKEFNDDHNEVCTPIFEYTVDGVNYTQKYNVYSSVVRYGYGDEVELLVNPDKPSDFMVADSIWMQITAGVLLGVGFVLFIISMALRHSANRTVGRSIGSYANYTQRQRPVVNRLTYTLNGVEHKEVDTEQTGYYNLNGKIVYHDDVSKLE